MTRSRIRRDESPRTPPPSSARSRGTCLNGLTAFPVHEGLSDRDLTLSRLLSAHSEEVQLKGCRPGATMKMTMRGYDNPKRGGSEALRRTQAVKGYYVADPQFYLRGYRLPQPPRNILGSVRR